MLIFVPSKTDPLVGAWMELGAVPRVSPGAVRAIFRARRRNKIVEGGMDPARATEDGILDVASMLGLSEHTVRSLCHLKPKPTPTVKTPVTGDNL